MPQDPVKSVYKSMKPAHSRRPENAKAYRREACRETGQECSLGSITGSSYPLQGQLCEVRMSPGSLGRKPALHCKTPRGGLRKPIRPCSHVCLPAPAASGLPVGSLPGPASLPPVLGPRVTPEPMSSRPAQNSPFLFGHSSLFLPLQPGYGRPRLWCGGPAACTYFLSFKTARFLVHNPHLSSGLHVLPCVSVCGSSSQLL